MGGVEPMEQECITHSLARRRRPLAFLTDTDFVDFLAVFDFLLEKYAVLLGKGNLRCLFASRSH